MNPKYQEIKRAMEQETTLMTSDELAEYLRVSVDTVRLWARHGRIPAMRLTRKAIRFNLNEVMAALARESPAPAPPPTMKAER